MGVEAIPARDLSRRKARNYCVLENWNSAQKVIGLCFFGPAPRSFIEVDDVVDAVRSATGWDITAQDISRVGERATNLARAFNVREGFTRQDDTLPVRLFGPLENGPLIGAAISKDEFEEAVTKSNCIPLSAEVESGTAMASCRHSLLPNALFKPDTVRVLNISSIRSAVYGIS